MQGFDYKRYAWGSLEESVAIVRAVLAETKATGPSYSYRLVPLSLIAYLFPRENSRRPVLLTYQGLHPRKVLRHVPHQCLVLSLGQLGTLGHEAGCISSNNVIRYLQVQ